jgi:phthiodiolone/phenolphthiodiolone dimycocerosates ketoreductase
MAIEVGAAGTILPPVEAVLRSAQRNEAAGFDAIWWPDHLMSWFPQSIWTQDITPVAAFQPNPHVYLDPVAVMAAVAVQTSRVRLGTSVTEPIRRHPAMLANEWLTLDHLSKGRAILGVGAGEAENVTPYGLSYAKPVSRFEESLRIVRLLWENDGTPVDFDGEFWTLRDAVCGLQPFEPGTYPPIWTGARGPRMLDITGRLADGWLPPFMLVEEYAKPLATIRAAASKAGRDPDAITPALWSYAIVAEDHETCHRLLRDRMLRANLLVLPSSRFERLGFDHPFGPGFDGIRDYIPSRLARDDALKAIEAIPDEVAHDELLHGTPDQLVERARAYESVGARHIVLWNITYLADVSLVRESFAMMDAVCAALHA